jgi:signal recognition particle receptor subunit beta
MIFAGPVGAGKTTAVRALSDVPTVDTDVPMTSAPLDDGDKTTTTVGLDYGAWRPTDEVSVALIGIPGQRRFDHARQTASLPGTRVLIWLRADRESLAADAGEWLDTFAADADRVVIAVSHCEHRTLGAVRRSLAETLRRHGIPASRVLAADARERIHVMRVASAALDLREENQ